MTLINDGYFHKILDHTDLSPCQSLFQQGEVLLRLKGFPVFLHRSMQCLGFPIKLRQFRFHLQGGVVFCKSMFSACALAIFTLLRFSKSGKEKPTTTPLNGVPVSVFRR